MNFDPINRGSKKKSSNLFIKLNDGDSITGIIKEPIVQYYEHWLPNQKKSIKCEGEGCSYCGEKDPRFKFKCNMILNQNGIFTAKILDQGWMIFKQLKKLNDDGYDLSRWAIKISREGTGLDTEYSVTPLPKGELSEKVLEIVDGVELNDLGVETKVEKEPSQEVQEEDEDIPF